MKKFLHKLSFCFDYYVGYFLTNGNKIEKWREYMMNKYPGEYKNEIKYVKEKAKQKTD